MIKIKFGKRISALRKAANMTQEALAEKAHYSVEFISLMERGQHGPSIDGIERLAKAMNLKESELFEFKEEEK